MKTIRQSTLAILIAVVSTAALGPGTFFPASQEEYARHARQGAKHAPATLPELEAGMRLALSGQPALTLAMLPDGQDPESVDFLAVDLALQHGNGLPSAGGHGWFAGAVAGNGLPASPGSGPGPGYGSIASAAARQAGQGPQSSGIRGASLPAMSGDPVSAFSADPAATGPSAIALDDPALTDSNVEQAPLLALAPPRGDIDGGGQAGGQNGGAAGTVPEPATLLLLGPGLLGLLAARRRRPAA